MAVWAAWVACCCSRLLAWGAAGDSYLHVWVLLLELRRCKVEALGMAHSPLGVSLGSSLRQEADVSLGYKYWVRVGVCWLFLAPAARPAAGRWTVAKESVLGAVF